MKTYFIRHTDALDISEETMEKLWQERMIAVHFPHAKDGGFKSTDNSSLDPEDYAPNGAKALRILWEIGNNGGYVCAVYRNREECLVGKVNEGTKPQRIIGKWGERVPRPGREAVLKGLQLKNVKVVKQADIPTIMVGRPRQGTLMRWPNAKRKIENLVNGVSEKLDWQDLGTPKQESFCAEFLRMPESGAMGLPALKFLLMPVGRTMKHIDIYGLAEDGKKVFGQVTYLHIKTKEAQEKMTKLKANRDEVPDSHSIMFCQCQSIEQDQGVWVVPVEAVFSALSKTPIGIAALAST